MKKSLFFGMAAMLMAGVTSCSNDDILSEGSKPLEADHTFFANIDIRSTESMTRANELTPDGNYTYNPSDEPDFNAGTTEENAVKTIYLIFYDENGDRVSTTQVRKDNMLEGGGLDDSQNSLYKGVVQIDVKHGSLKPAYVMCFINPITSMNFDINPSFATLAELQKTTRPRIIDDNDNFAMSKSVYYGVNRTRPDYSESMQGNPNYYEKIIATPIGESQLFDTVEAAQDALDNDDDNNHPGMIDIYVERYAAKVNFEITNAANTAIEVDGEALEFVPEYWAVNAYENETYICKSFLNEALTEDMSYSTMNSALGGAKAWYWNSPQHHRCYWAQTPGYYSAKYPRVADDILDNRTEDDRLGGFGLGYYSYNEMKANATGTLIAKARAVEKGKSTTIYARENTTAGAALKAAYDDPMASPKAAIASAVLVGHYTIGGRQVPADQTFYVSGNAVNGYTFYKDDEEMLTWFVNTTVQFAKNRAGDTFYTYGIENYGFTDSKYKQYFKIEHPQYAVRTLDGSNPAVVDSRFVTVQLDNDKVLAEGADPLYAYLDGRYQQVTALNIDKVNQQMYYQAGTVQGFQGGKAYFTIPIKHLGFYRDGNVNAGKMGTEKNFDWTNVMSGDFGLVRNHIYTVQVTGITGLGNGIPNPDDPIVPPTDPEDYFIGARIIVLNWAVVPTQSVVL